MQRIKCLKPDENEIRPTFGLQIELLGVKNVGGNVVGTGARVVRMWWVDRRDCVNFK